MSSLKDTCCMQESGIEPLDAWMDIRSLLMTRDVQRDSEAETERESVGE